MQPLTWQLSSDFPQSPIVDFRIASVFLLTKGRNAWHSTWIRRYQGSHALYGTVQEAMDAAESQRGPGNVFYIRQVPALLAYFEIDKFDDRCVVLVDFHSDNSFGNWSFHESGSKLEIGSPIGPLLQALSADGTWRSPPPNPHSLVVAKAIPSEIDVETYSDELQSWTSSAQGSSRPLAWFNEENQYVFDGVLAVEKRFFEVNGEERIISWRAERKEGIARRIEEIYEDLRMMLAEEHEDNT